MSRVLVTRISSFGDVALLVPVIYSVAAMYPHDRFVVLTRKSFAPLFENLGFNISTKSFDMSKHRSFFGLLRLIRSVSIDHFSYVADMHDVLRTSVLRKAMWLQGKKVAHIDKGKHDKNNLIKNKTLTHPLKSTIERYSEVFERLGFPFEMSFTHFFEFRERSLYPLRSLVSEKQGKWIGIAPFSKHNEKIYPLKKMENIIKLLSSNPENNLFLFGAGKAERAILDKWVEKYPRAINVSGKLPLDLELLLISYLDVMLSMDSANMHLASLVEVPVVSVWGATHPYLGFYGYNQDFDNAIQADLSCRPCSVFGDVPCFRKDYACMNMIDESTIIKKVEQILNKQ
ncbi:lipopolysaccharide heptosyltransferase family protein [Dysgonomonas sp. 216]|uniref:glycosyltransferase family 9 protein n=1 Tax=Dysgonomonas sp. 216 TaxID=2302934 RepID=UPI0013D1457E|nr:glycosyltransferase family 9 protein [Dysgonomonas sp. 216]NDW17508.1 lipopolysaccharide heptosyltransferase family protein [Dysgonomonas sp. 216]